MQVKQCQPGISFNDTSKELGRLWREASVRTKAEYGEKAKADRVRISKALLAYRGHLQTCRRCYLAQFSIRFYSYSQQKAGRRGAESHAGCA